MSITHMPVDAFGDDEHVMRLAAFLCLAAGLVGVTSCSVSVGSVHDDQFRAVWSPDWAVVNAAARPLAPSAGNPGDCNIGSSATACVRTGQNMVAALTKLETDLEAVTTPQEYTGASTTIRHAIQIDIKGITDRNNAIKARDNRLFSTAITEVQQAAKMFPQGYAQFPQTTRPTPQPFDGGFSG
jgi:hypothetical protein